MICMFCVYVTFENFGRMDMAQRQTSITIKEVCVCAWCVCAWVWVWHCTCCVCVCVGKYQLISLFPSALPASRPSSPCPISLSPLLSPPPPFTHMHRPTTVTGSGKSKSARLR